MCFKIVSTRQVKIKLPLISSVNSNTISFLLLNYNKPDVIGKIEHYVGEDFFGFDKGSDRFYDEKEEDNDNCNNQALVFFYHTTLASQSYRKDNTAFLYQSTYLYL